MTNIERHPLTPFINLNSRILMLGAFPPKQNRWSMQFYYPNWINDMWRIMGIIFFSDKNHFCNIDNKTFHLDAIKTFLIDNGIALHDTAEAVIRLKDNASDKYLSIVETINLNKILINYPNITTIVTTGEKAAGVISNITNTKIPEIGKFEAFTFENRVVNHFRMPSSSRAYPLSIDKKANFYKVIFDHFNDVNVKKNI